MTGRPVALFALAAGPPHSPAAALADPTHVSLAQALGAGDEMCGCDRARVIGRSQPLVSHHVKVLREAGLVDARRDGRIVFSALTSRGRRVLEALRAAKEVAR